MISIGASHNTCHLFLGEITVERKGRSIQGETGPMDIGRKLALGQIGQKNSGDVKVHFVAVPADYIIAVYVPVAVDEVINKAAREQGHFALRCVSANYKKLMFAVRRAPLRTGQGSGVVLQILHFVQDDKSGSFRMTENTAQDVQEGKMRAGG